jgi:hypothetical protein
MMIFQHTWNWILKPSHATGEVKTQTRRLVKTGDCLSGSGFAVLNSTGKERWSIGHDYAVQPARGKPAIQWWANPDNGEIAYAHDAYNVDPYNRIPDSIYLRSIDMPYKPLCIRITDIRREDVRTISEADAHAEGFTSSLEFLRVWCSMHDKGAIKASQAGDYLMLGARPAALYDAWALTFEAVR